MAVDLGDLPAAGAVALEPANAAWIKMEVTVVIQMRAGDTADDADDRKVVAHDDDVIHR